MASPQVVPEGFELEETQSGNGLPEGFEREELTLPFPGGQKVDISTDEGQRELKVMLGRDPKISQQGVKDFQFRAGLSRMDTPEEREMYLLDKVGEKGFIRDKKGRFALTLKGMKVLGVEGDRPTIIDEPGLTKYDIADIRGEAPAILAGTVAGIATGGLGFLPAVGITALSAGAAKGVDETMDALRGENLQKIEEVTKDIATEAALAAGGETIYRGILAPLGKRILAPNISKLKPGAEELTEEALAMGVRPKAVNLVNRPIVERISGMVDTIFGDINAGRNSVSINRQIDKLRSAFGKQIDNAVDLGTLIKDDVIAARKAFGNAASAKFALVDEFTKGQKLINTSAIKVQAKELIESLPQSVEGKPILVAPERVKQLQEVLSLPENVTVEQLQALRTTLMDRIEDTITPGIKSREASLLVRKANKVVDDTIEQMGESVKPKDILGKQALESLKEARAYYKHGIRQFDNATIKRISKNPSIAGSIDPERVVDVLFKKGSVTPIKRVFDVVHEGSAQRIKTAAMDRILESAYKESGDPLITSVFDGTGFIKTLNSYGKPTLEAMFGAQKTKELYTLGRVIQVASKPKAGSGGLVAASIAVQPLQNLGRLLKLRVMGQVMNSENGIRWLTHGLKAPKTREGAMALSRFTTQLQILSEQDEE